MQAGLVCRTLQLALVQRPPAPGLIVHTDRCSRYNSAVHQASLATHGLVGCTVSPQIALGKLWRKHGWRADAKRYAAEQTNHLSSNTVALPAISSAAVGRGFVFEVPSATG